MKSRITVPALLRSCLLLSFVFAANNASAYVGSVLAGGDIGFQDGIGAAARFNHPTALTADSFGNIYVADTGNNCVRMISAGGFVSTLSLNSSGTPLTLDAPTGLAVGPSNELIVADTGNGPVYRLQPNSFAASKIATFSKPTSVAVDASGAIYVADGGVGKIFEVDAGGSVSVVSGSENIPGTVSSVAIAIDGGLLIQTVSAQSLVAAAYELKAGALNKLYVDAGGFSTAVISSTYNAITTDMLGNIFLTDGPFTVQSQDFSRLTMSRIIELPANGGSTPIIQSFSSVQLPQMGPPPVLTTGIASDAAGNLYYIANSQVVECALDSGVPAPVASHALSANEGVPVSLSLSTAEAGLLTGATIHWSKDGAPIAGANAATLAIAGTQTDAGVYALTQVGGQGPGIKFAVGVNQNPGSSYLANWSTSAVGASATHLNSVAFDGSTFLAGGSNGLLWSSPDGHSWVQVATVPLGINQLVIDATGHALIGVGDHGEIFNTAGPAYSAQLQATPSSADLQSVAVSPNLAVAVGASGTILLQNSPSGTWSKQSVPAATDLSSIIFGNGSFVAVGKSGTIITSIDGANWVSRESGGTLNFSGVAYGRGAFIALGNDGMNSQVIRSTDGINWTVITAFPGFLGAQVAYFNRTFIVVGNGAVWSSTDGGITWISDQLSSDLYLQSVAFANERFVSVASDGEIAISASAQAKLINLSARGFVVGGTSAVTAGFVTGGSGTLTALFRGIGPGLVQFGVSPAVTDPQLYFYSQGGSVLGSNGGWGSSTDLQQLFAQLGAFALLSNSHDTALTAAAPLGPNSISVTSASGQSGYALAEIYDTGIASNARLVNVSTESPVGPQDLIVGFVISGTEGERLLIRGIGPSLGQFGVANPLALPRIRIFDVSGDLIATDDSWGGSSALATAFSNVGAFALSAGSSDSALLVSLAPGVYTAELSGVNGAPGTGLIELYEMP